MKKIVVASQNPVKIQAVQEGFAQLFPSQQFTVEGVSVESGVRDQPATDDETFLGAYNRMVNAAVASPEADYWVGIEGGIEKKVADMEAFAWVVVRAKDGRIGKSKTATFFLPPKVAELIDQGMELAEADDLVFERQNSKHSTGAVGILTGEVITRTTYYSHAVVCALIPFCNPELYPARQS